MGKLKNKVTPLGKSQTKISSFFQSKNKECSNGSQKLFTECGESKGITSKNGDDVTGNKTPCRNLTADERKAKLQRKHIKSFIEKINNSSSASALTSTSANNDNFTLNTPTDIKVASSHIPKSEKLKHPSCSEIVESSEMTDCLPATPDLPSNYPFKLAIGNKITNHQKDDAMMTKQFIGRVRKRYPSKPTGASPSPKKLNAVSRKAGHNSLKLATSADGSSIAESADSSSAKRDLRNVYEQLLDVESSGGKIHDGSRGVTGCEDLWLEAEIDGLSDQLFSCSPCKPDAGSERGVVDEIRQREPLVRDYNRYKVESVTLEDDCGRQARLVLTRTNGSNTEITCVLRGFWLENAKFLSVGDIVHLVFTTSDQLDSEVRHPIIIDDSHNLIIINPDRLISGTTVVSSLHCMRRSVLTEMYKGYERQNIYMLYGSIIHSFVQTLLQKESCTRDGVLTDNEVKTCLESVIRQSKTLHDMYSVGVSEEAVVAEVDKYVVHIRQWLSKYWRRKTSAAPTNGKNAMEITAKLGDVKICEVRDIEETIWSPRYGIKGKVDVTVKASAHRETLILPVELKTGRPTFSLEHQGQCSLYNVMLSEKYRESFPRTHKSLLVYLIDAANMKTVETKHQHVAGLIQLRNELCFYLSCQATTPSPQTPPANDSAATHGGGCGDPPEPIGDLGTCAELPQPISDRRTCSKCPHLLSCSLYDRGIEGREYPSDHVRHDLITDTTSHLSARHLDYYRKWTYLLQVERDHTVNTRPSVKQVWCDTARKCEADGVGLECLVISDDAMHMAEDVKRSTVDQHTHTFTRHSRFNNSNSAISGLSVGERVLVSVEHPLPRIVAVASGFIHHISSTTLTVALDRNLRSSASDSGEDVDWKQRVFRVDRCEYSNSSATGLVSVVKLMLPQHQRLREIIIDKAPPKFRRTLSRDIVMKIRPVLKSLNESQQRAVLKSLMAEDYILIKGMPGTGKTHTIATLVRILVLMGQRVLLTSYTHSAVDNILIKLMKYEQDIKVIRLGRSERVHPSVRQYSADLITSHFTTTDQLTHYYQSASVVAGTCLSVSGSPSLDPVTGAPGGVSQDVQFDVCICDEASQVSQPTCLSTLYLTRVFMLVGDDQQLPPVVLSPHTRSLGMDESLFTSLMTAENTQELDIQYRMNSEVMRLCNQLIYDNKLTCGSQTVASSTIALPHQSLISLQLSEAEDEWLQSVVSEELESSVLFLNTEQLVTHVLLENSSSITSTTNDVEAKLASYIAQLLIKCGASGSDVGIITPYRGQVSLIKEHITTLLVPTTSCATAGGGGVEVNTVDQYQGRDKSCIIVSFVKHISDIKGEQSTRGVSSRSSILDDYRRLNVSISRAKHKLILLGSRHTLLSNYLTLSSLIQGLRPGQVKDVPVSGLERLQDLLKSSR